MRPRLLDLFSGAGGAAMGYFQAFSEAGIDVEIVGVDVVEQPRYPFTFVQADALTYPLEGFDFIHASPVCKGFSVARTIHGVTHPDQLTPIRARLSKQEAPWVIENVPGAPMRPDYVLCGSHFGERRLKRHRWFECSWPVAYLMHPCSHADGNIVSVFGHGGHIYHGVDDWRKVMGIDWMTRDELAQAIPPPYTRFIGEQLIQQLKVAS